MVFGAGVILLCVVLGEGVMPLYDVLNVGVILLYEVLGAGVILLYEVPGAGTILPQINTELVAPTACKPVTVIDTPSITVGEPTAPSEETPVTLTFA